MIEMPDKTRKALATLIRDSIYTTIDEYVEALIQLAIQTGASSIPNLLSNGNLLVLNLSVNGYSGLSAYVPKGLGLKDVHGKPVTKDHAILIDRNALLIVPKKEVEKYKKENE